MPEIAIRPSPALTSASCNKTNYACSSQGFSELAGVLWPTYEESNPAFNALATGYVNVPENPGRIASASGGQYGSTFVLTDVRIPSSYTGSVAVSVVLTGTLQACLLPMGGYLPYYTAPCDPAFANFATININVAGLNVMNFYYGMGVSNEFIGTAAAAPEPANLAIFGCGALLSSWLIRKRTRFPGMLNRLAGFPEREIDAGSADQGV